MKHSIYDPVKDQLIILVEYINFLKTKKNADTSAEIAALQHMLRATTNHCELYLNLKLSRICTNGNQEL
jgi:hypothetical protein